MKSFKQKNNGYQLGSAVTEFALLTLIFIPIILYAFFAGEAGRVLLLMQEEVIASIWDFAAYPYNYEKTHEYGGMNQAFDKGISDANPISIFNRIQYIDEDSSFTNSRRQNTNSYVSNGRERYVTNAFVVGTHCGGGACKNELEDYERPSDDALKRGYENNNAAADDSVHEVFCGIASKAGKFATDKLIDMSKGSPGGLAVCQGKARLKNYIIPSGKFFPNFYGDDFSLAPKDFKGDNMKKYDSTKRVIDNQGYSGDIIIRHRAALLTDSWNISEHDDIKLFNNISDVLNASIFGFDLASNQLRFKDRVSKIVTAANILGPNSSVSNYSKAAKNANIASIPNPTGGVDSIINPLITRTNMVAYYPHGSGKLGDYSYDPLLGKSGLSGIADIFKKETPYFTTPLYNGDKAKYENVFNDRGAYYMGSKQSQAQGN